MPALNFPGNQLNSQYLHAIMTYPNDVSARNQLLRIAGYKYSIEGDAEQHTPELTTETLREILNSPTFDEIIKNASNKASRGQIAGQILIFLTSMQTHGFIEPSLNKALFLAARYYGTAENSKAELAPSSKPKLKAIWHEFKPAVHLWAAYIITADNFETLDFNDYEQLSFLLSVANWFEEFLANFKPQRQPIKNDFKNGIIDTVQLYRLETFKDVTSISFSVKLKDWILQELSGYTAD